MSISIKPKGPDERSGSFPTNGKDNGPTTQSLTVDFVYRKRVKTARKRVRTASTSSIMGPPPPSRKRRNAQSEMSVERRNAQSEMSVVLGRLALWEGRIPEALSHIEHALKINPANQDAQDALADIEKAQEAINHVLQQSEVPTRAAPLARGRNIQDTQSQQSSQPIRAALNQTGTPQTRSQAKSERATNKVAKRALQQSEVLTRAAPLAQRCNIKDTRPQQSFDRPQTPLQPRPAKQILKFSDELQKAINERFGTSSFDDTPLLQNFNEDALTAKELVDLDLSINPDFSGEDLPSLHPTYTLSAAQ